MIITKISRRRKSLTAVFFDEEVELKNIAVSSDGGYLFDTKTFDSFMLCENRLIDMDTLDELVYSSLYSRAKEKALYLLSARSYTKKGLCSKLAKDFGENVAEDVCNRLEELSLLDDFEYARRRAEVLLSVKKVSARQAVLLLMQKGVAHDIAKAAVEELDPSADDQLDQLIESKYYRDLEKGDPKSINRVINALARKGFSFSDIRSAVRRYCDSAEIYED